MQSGISASQELHTAFQKLVSDESQRGLIITIEKEALVPSTTLPSNSSSFDGDLPLLTPHLQPKTALYIILRRYPSNTPAPFIAVTYVPDAAPVRQKMLFASTRLTLVRELGIERFRETIFATREDELSAEGFKKHDKHNELAAPLTEEEVSLGEVKRKEAEEGRGAGERKSHVSSGVSMPVTEEALGALKGLSSGEGDENNLVQLQINIATETMELASVTSTPISALPKTISNSAPRYSFYRFTHEHAGQTQSPILFIYTCPSGSKIKERMLYAASSRSAVQVAEAEAGIKVEKRVEAGSPEDVDEESILGDLHPKVEVKKAFERPRRPGRK
ncbi:Actin depolymerizing protein [Glarea lozoyensis ATCC 20868]|uniref:Twinfilin n=1 Tax=Glarea lozoyensis (strain ATCC 20868 / MF5171) TaxID=1116229 RepID=S3CYU0_GLAL2|nr:Actin depolymerizing protein [Glarea lozoyensis ATCC 20868]EPE25001.1 Actin depolymerizing protein [Glarea lozoyensis ATCC 20868]